MRREYVDILYDAIADYAATIAKEVYRERGDRVHRAPGYVAKLAVDQILDDEEIWELVNQKIYDCMERV